MKVVVVGSGGREHALAWKCAQSEKVSKVFVCPGNGGTNGGKMESVKIELNDAPDFTNLVKFVEENGVELTIIGPEQPLVDGITDAFNKKGLKCFGPTKNAAILEGSKAFSKDFMKRHNIPTADYFTFDDKTKALDYIRSLPENKRVVVKASGLAAGKGVILPENKNEAEDAVNSIMDGGMFGVAGETCVIEELLIGWEVSLLAFTDGVQVAPWPPAQDHKRAYDGDLGPNTGGMGAYAPAPQCDDELKKRIVDEILLPTIKGIADEGHPYIGIIYAGIMVTADGPKCLEFNCRGGDPETQVAMVLLESDLVDICVDCVNKRLDASKVIFSHHHCITVVLASGGYPGNYKKDIIIEGLDNNINNNNNNAKTVVFHAGTKLKDNKCYTNGGRVLAVTAEASTLREAKDNVYNVISHINFADMQYRTDIAHQALQPKRLHSSK